MGIATLVIPIGRLAGARTRRSGAAPRSRWAAPCPSHMIATRGILIGRLDGVQTRRSGAAPTRRWGARRSVAIEHPAAHGGRLFISGTRMAKLLARVAQTDRHR